jgi:hypothetical protein
MKDLFLIVRFVLTKITVPLLAKFSLQRIIFELNQNLRIPVEQAINIGKRLYSPDKDSSGMESAGM